MEFTKTDQPAIAMDSKCGANPSDEGPIDLQDEHGVGTAEILLLPDGGYGWVCVTAVLLINAHTWGISTARDPYSDQCVLLFANPSLVL